MNTNNSNSNDSYLDGDESNRGSDKNRNDKDYDSRAYSYGDAYYDDGSDYESIDKEIEKGRQIKNKNS